LIAKLRAKNQAVKKKRNHRWPSSKLLRVRQGHFGYRALRETPSQITLFIQAS